MESMVGSRKYVFHDGNFRLTKKGGFLMKRKLVAGFAIVLLIVGLSGVVNATVLTSEISLDNGFIAYLSTSDSVQGIEFGAGNNWNYIYTFDTTLQAGVDYYLHIYGYDQGGYAGFLGEFTLSGTDHVFSNDTLSLLTNTTDWKGNNTGWTDSYTTLTDYGTPPVEPWEYYYTYYGGGSISGSAHWIWAGDNDSNDYAYFTTKIFSTAPVPEPTTILLLGSGLAGFAGLRRRFRKS